MAAIRPGRPAAKRAPAAAQQAEAPPPPPPPPAAPKRRNLMLPAIVVAVALLGAAFLMSSGGKSSKTNNVQASTTATSVAPVADGDVVTLDPITMNLASGDVVKVGIALQLNGPSGSSVAKKALADSKNFGARALDELISVLSDYSRDELAKQGGIADAKAKLTKRLALVYKGDVTGVYFTQFVIA